MSLTFRPKRDKIIELLLYLAHKRPNCDHYQAVKFVYLADKEHLNRFGRPITFDEYYAMPLGPVPSNTLALLKEQEAAMRAADIDRLPFNTETIDRITIIREPRRPLNYELFSRSDLRVFDEIIGKYGNYSFNDLYELTHSHFAYRNAWEKRPAGAKRVKMQYDDMVDEGPNKASMIEDFSPVSKHM